MRNFRWLFAFVIAAALTPAGVAAQQAATVSGRVTSEAGTPVANATVSITQLNVGATTGADGNYTFTIPASRVTAAVRATVTATRLGYASQEVGIDLAPGATITQNFQLGTDVLQLEGIVATGQGTQTTRERLTTAVSTVQSQDITRSNENNVVQALAGKAPSVNVTSSSGDPGAGSYIRIRDAASIVGGTQPLFIVDGTPIDNSSNQIESGTAGTAVANRASDLNPADIEDVQVLKGSGATAIYGSRGANGVILITTKSGQAGGTRATLSSSVGFNKVNQLPALQTQFGRGLTSEALNPNAPVTNLLPTTSVTYGPALAAGTETFNHADELFETGTRYDNNLTVSGGNDRTTYFLGVGRADNNGTIPDAQDFSRTSVRLKGSHFFSEDIQVSGNVAYATTGGDYIQQGSNTSGLLLGALRTPPEFDNLPFLTEGGLQRSYRRPNPTSPNQGSGYDNPFFQINQGLNTSEVGRTFGNIQIDYAPVTWLKLNYTLGADYSSDERRTLLPKSSATQPTGKFIRANFVTDIIDSNLTATASGTLRDSEQGSLVGSLTVGQNLNQEDFRQNLIETDNIFRNTAETDFSVDRRPDEFRSRIRTDGYFATGELTYNDQLTFTGTGRYDGSSTFGGDNRFFYPSVGASWVFSKLPAFDNVKWLDFGKLRAAWGKAGRQPPVFSNVTGFVVGNLDDGFVFGQGFNTIYQGQQGVLSQTTLRNPDIKPEVKTEFEIGGDLAFFGQRASLGVTYFDNRTEDVILSVPVPPSTGFNARLNNAAEFTGDGIEVTLDLIPVQMDNFSWNIGAQYANTNTCVEDIAGAEAVFLAGFTASTASLVSQEVTGECQQFGVLYGDDFVRFGRGTVVDEQNIDAAFPGTADGTLYIGEDGFPLLDDQQRVGGDPNPDWTGSIRNTFTIANNLRITGLVDVKQGGDVWNGTKGALVFFGTSEASLSYHGAGTQVTFGDNYMPNFGVNPNFGGGVAGPGVGTPVVLNWDTWAIGGIGSGFTGPFTQFIEDGSFVKLRDISVSYALEMPWIERLGFTSIDLTASGRNLKTWTDYTGIDPESNLTGQSTGRGLDYFNNPQTRSYIFTVNLNK